MNIPKGFSWFFFVTIQFFTLFLKYFQKATKKTPQNYVLNVFTLFSASYLKNFFFKKKRKEKNTFIILVTCL
jgi:hypothetical protein